MGAVCNQMKPRSVAVTTGTPSTIVGIGFEGVADGANTVTVTVDGTGVNGIPKTTGIVTVTIYRRAVIGGSLIPDATTVAVPAAGAVIIPLPGVSVYEIQMTAQTSAGVDESVQVEVMSQRIG